MEVLARAIREEKEIKGIKIGKEEVKLSLFADNLILYLENPKGSTRNLLGLPMNIVKLQDIKLTHRNPLHSYILTIKKQKEKLRKQLNSPLQQKRIKYLGIKLPKETKDLHIENYKTLMKEIKDDTNRWKNIPCSCIGRINIVKMSILPNL